MPRFVGTTPAMDDSKGGSSSGSNGCSSNDTVNHLQDMLYEQRANYEELLAQQRLRYEQRLQNQRAMFMEQIRVLKEHYADCVHQTVNEYNENLDEARRIVQHQRQHYENIIRNYTDDDIPPPPLLEEDEDEDPLPPPKKKVKQEKK